ncbi:hypothetical protein GCM10009854_22780 [Saccharopolyspora halophila]|uniref:Uncharacterized protein n=1 Tax=Saccharopolyspora halophila TaxID=405551 RepID=A0ABN3G7T5_9PSEU
MRDRPKMLRSLTEQWCGRGENLVFVVGGEHKSGWFGATVGNAPEVPHSAPDDGLQPPWPQVNPGLTAGEFLADEWVHDPAVWGWACADSPERAAVRAGESLNAGKHFCWLVCTDQRFAVVVEADAQAEARRQVEQAAESPGRLGGLFGRGKQREAPAHPLETRWQYPLDQGIDFSPAELGRAADPVEFVRVRFADDSTLDFRMLDAADLVATVRKRLR